MFIKPLGNLVPVLYTVYIIYTIPSQKVVLFLILFPCYILIMLVLPINVQVFVNANLANKMLDIM